MVVLQRLGVNHNRFGILSPISRRVYEEFICVYIVVVQDFDRLVIPTTRDPLRTIVGLSPVGVRSLNPSASWWITEDHE
jgi:hypothetical protein